MLALIYLVLDCCPTDDKERENPFVLLPKIDKCFSGLCSTKL